MKSLTFYNFVEVQHSGRFDFSQVSVQLDARLSELVNRAIDFLENNYRATCVDIVLIPGEYEIHPDDDTDTFEPYDVVLKVYRNHYILECSDENSMVVSLSCRQGEWDTIE
ncbi:MAG: hypothetical protein KatS3mg023_3596 [Armatimonadota bacterium]|nr:MAG: hypothetical protein KatS3mg023_3596 [Armatimonadota bacterium]